MRFSSRQEAGRELGRRLVQSGLAVDWVLGLPRGGVVVAAEVARALRRPLGVLVVRKIGHPQHREYAVGALAEGGICRLAESIAGGPRPLRAALVSVLAEERGRLQEYQEKFHRGKMPDYAGQNLLLVDDGLATGATAEAAVASARQSGARHIFMAVPVASPGAVRRLAAACDGVTTLVTDPEFAAVGQYYAEFLPTRDAEVLALLSAGGERPPGAGPAAHRYRFDGNALT